MAGESLTALVTGAGAPGIRGTLYALRRNPESLPVRIVGIDLREDAVGRHLCDGFRRVPPPESPEYAAALSEVCREERVGVVLPQTTREIEVLCHEADNLRRQGIAVAVSSPEAIGLSNNKWKLLQVFEELGLPHPRYFLAREPREVAERAAELGYPARPVVVKPPQSNGMRGFRVLTERPWDVRRFMQEKPDGTEMRLADLLAILRSGSEYPALLVTEYLEGPEYSVDAFAGRAGAVAVPRLRKAIRSGISFETVLEDRRDLIDSTLCAAGRIGLRYAFGFQYKLDAAGTPKVLECNPRIQGTMAAGVFGGVNVIWMALCEAVGRPVVIPTSDLQRASFLRYWGGVGLHADGCDEI